MSYEITNLEPERNYSVQICALCEGQANSSNCIETQQYRTLAGEMQMLLHVYIVYGLFCNINATRNVTNLTQYAVI